MKKMRRKIEGKMKNRREKGNKKRKGRVFWTFYHLNPPYKNNYPIYTNIFFICNILHIIRMVEVSNIFELIYYFM
jgi:hypothetical protein